MLKNPPDEMTEFDYKDIKETADRILKFADKKVNGKKKSEDTVRFMNEFNRLDQDLQNYQGHYDTETQEELESRLYRVRGMLDDIAGSMTREEVANYYERLENMQLYLSKTRETLEELSRIAHM